MPGATTPECTREHVDEWVEVDDFLDLPGGTRIRREWVTGVFDGGRSFIHRDDLPSATQPEGAPMTPANENVTVVTDRDRTPDPVATVKPFCHPWISGDDTCGECGKPFREHWWVDAGGHGHTVCRLPERVEWVALTEGQVAALPDRTPVRLEWGGVVTEGALHREGTGCDEVHLHHSGSSWWAGDMPDATVRVHPEDVPDPDPDLVERAAKAAFDAAEEVASNAPTGRPHRAEWDDADSLSKDVHRAAVRAVIALVRGEQA